MREDGVGLGERNILIHKNYFRNFQFGSINWAIGGVTIWRSSPNRMVARIDMASSLLVITSTRPCGGQTQNDTNADRMIKPITSTLW